jgi:S-DNA-T family DNA segregation ATPase FtsK/SpoIIIE
LRHAEPLDFSSHGLPARSLPKPSELSPGRGFAVVNALEFQVASPPAVPNLADQVAAAWRGVEPSAERIARLPSTLTVGDLVRAGGSADCRAEPWRLPVGLADANLEPAVLPLYRGDHILVAGPPRSGRSSCLALIGQQLLSCEAPPSVLAIATRPSPVRDCAGVELAIDIDHAAELLDSAATRAATERVVVLLDDADLLSDLDAKIAALISIRGPDCHVAFVARNDSLRSLFGHWTQDARKSRLGILLRPDIDLDGSLLSAQLPRRQRRADRPGLGYVVLNGSPTLTQCAYPGASPPGSAQG